MYMRILILFLILFLTSCATTKKQQVVRSAIKYEIQGKPVTKKEYYDLLYKVWDEHDRRYINNQGN
jgi:PBP1b-binding outer membrane lipoprotein LpoB